jgi:hypothetical protein
VLSDLTVVTSSVKIGAIPTPSVSGVAMAASVQFGKVFQPQQQILLYSPDEWESFIQEWVHSQRQIYADVQRFAGANDMGVDIAGFSDSKGLIGVWDNFQCKHYDNALTPSVAAGEIAKMLWHSFKKEFAPPRAYYFIAPKDCGMKLKKLLLNPGALKKHVVDNWFTQCADAVSGSFTIDLVGAFAAYVDNFDFSIFKSRTTLEIIDEHRKTPYHATRFGGGLGARPRPPAPGPMHAGESRYVAQLLEAYGDRLKMNVADVAALTAHPEMEEHFNRQREFFYHAESLRNFARDTVPPGTFEDLQSEVHAGVIDIEAEDHPDALTRCNRVSQAAASLALTANALISTLMVQDRKGICHQLANDDRLRWKKP